MKTKLKWLTQEGLDTLKRGYLLPGELPEDMFMRVAKASAQRLGRDKLAEKFYNYMCKNWLCLASPVASNMGTDRGLPISCFSLRVKDSVDDIFTASHEQAMMSKHGGGVALTLSNVRGRGAKIKDNGESEGIVSWCRLYDQTCQIVSQGGTRRGAASVNLSINHPDIAEFIEIRRQEGDIERQCNHLNHCVVIDDAFMSRLENKDKEAEYLMAKIYSARLETGEPYIMFGDTVNRANPQAYRNNNLIVEGTNICSEILLTTDDNHSFVCCLSSLNLNRWDEWKDSDLPEVAIWFLDGVMQEFIDKAKAIPGFERAVRFSEKSRALGLGVLGWHTLLQSKNLPFDTSLPVMGLNTSIFKFIQDGAIKASMDLAKEYGEPEWCKGTGMRNTHTMALAPTVTNSVISGNVSAGIEPLPANAYTHKTAKGIFLRKNPTFELLLESKKKNKPSVWKSVLDNDGSVQHLDFLSDQEKEVFLTAKEMSQMNLIRQAAARQSYIDQSQSLNLFFPANVDPKWFHKVHMEAWKLGIKTLYYCRSSSVLKGDMSRLYDDNCKACEG